jgi:glycosyltransferase involved in cell wall biosynthesis
MKIVVGLTYYRPHTSGLTIYAERLARALVRRGHAVTILTSHYDRTLPRHETVDGVEIVRAPVMLRISKGVIMPTLGWLATQLIAKHDVIHLHLPQFDAAGMALRGLLMNKPTLLTYHCDLQMPNGVISRTANAMIHLMNNLAAYFAHRIVTYTQDYADHSFFLRRNRKKVAIIDPPVEVVHATQAEMIGFKNSQNPQMRHPVIGMAARFATEKGVEVLVKSLPSLLRKYPNLLVQFAGPYRNIIGEEQYWQRLGPVIAEYERVGVWRFVENLDQRQMSAFFSNIDLLVLSSLNSTEAFGLVQIEAMMHGKPCVASDLPGVRQPVLRHHMGRIFPVGDSEKLAEAATEVLEERQGRNTLSERLARQYAPDLVAKEYETLFLRVQDELKNKKKS